MVFLTKEKILAGMTSNMVISKKQAVLLGILKESDPYQLPKGWLKCLEGKSITEETYDKFLSYKKYKTVIANTFRKHDFHSIKSIKKEDLFTLSDSQKWEIIQFLINELEKKQLCVSNDDEKAPWD
jgi:hypothetical protein